MEIAEYEIKTFKLFIDIPEKQIFHSIKENETIF